MEKQAFSGEDKERLLSNWSGLRLLSFYSVVDGEQLRNYKQGDKVKYTKLAYWLFQVENPYCNFKKGHLACLLLQQQAIKIVLGGMFLTYQG
jgi:hypothetical protein